MNGQTNTTTAPKWLLWAGILFLLWNLIGVAAFASQWSMSADDIGKLPPEQRDMWLAMPGWAWVAYAAGVLLGTLGAIGIVLRKWWAPLAFAFSLIAIIVQFSHPFFYLQQNNGDMAMLGFPIFIIVMAIIQWQLARAWQRKGWLA
jgi:hypothetical protein